MTVSDYIAKSDELDLRCNVREDADVRLSRFRTSFDPRSFEQKPIPLSAKPNSGTGQPYKGPNNYPTRNERGKRAPEGSRRPGQQQCYRCCEYGHYVVECPARNLLIEDAEVEDDPLATDY